VKDSKPQKKYSDYPEDKKVMLRIQAVNRARNRKQQDPEGFGRKQRESSMRWKRRNPDKVRENRRRCADRMGWKYDPERNSEARKEARKLDREYSRIAIINAKQAWQYWMRVKAPDEWMIAYYKSKGTPWFNPRLSEACRYRTRYRLDTEFNLKEKIRRQAAKAKKRDGIGEVIRGALHSKGKSLVVEQRLGYSINDLKIHLGKQFTKGMSWDKYMEGRIHIDHIVPQSSFNTADDSEWRECWSMSNLRPMWAGENIRKSDHREFLL